VPLLVMGVNGADEPAAIVANEAETPLFRDRDSSRSSAIRTPALGTLASKN
jgi:hypothetical protein